jgi:hypothetical protein
MNSGREDMRYGREREKQRNKIGAHIERRGSRFAQAGPKRRERERDKRAKEAEKEGNIRNAPEYLGKEEGRERQFLVENNTLYAEYAEWRCGLRCLK